MLWNRWLPALAATTLFVGCAGGSTPTTPPLGQQGITDSLQRSEHFSVTAAPAVSLRSTDDAIGGYRSSLSAWQFLEPLNVSDTGTFSESRNTNKCSPFDPLLGVWYVAHDSFTLPENGASLPACSNPIPYNNLYIVELTVGLFSVNVTPVAGPAPTNASTWSFQPMQSSLSFTKGTLYSFFVATYNGPTLAQPNMMCEIGATTCSLTTSPNHGDKLVVIVSDGSGQLPNLVVKDSAGKALKRETVSPNCGHCVAVYDETVTSGITGTVHYSGGTGLYYPYESAIYELANVNAGRFTSANTAGNPSSLATTISEVRNNDIQFCAYMQTGTSNFALAFSNGSSPTYDYQTTVAAFAREIATTTAPSTCTANNINAGYEAGMAYAAYR